MLENIDTFQLAQVGAVGVMLIMTWKFMVKKDRKIFEMIEAQNQERKEMYQSMTELITEVTIALNDKNHTDNKMAEAIQKLTDKLCEIRQGLKNRES